jgi:hypothetical protein
MGEIIVYASRYFSISGRMYKEWAMISIGLIICNLPTTGWAQQNLFNVPSSEITEKNKFFFQQQFNFASLGESNTTVDFGLGNDLEIGINLFNLNVYSNTTGLTNPNFLFNFQKAFNINEIYKVSFGTQTGLTPPLYNATIRIPSFSYINNAVDLEKWGKYYLGSYYANPAYAGSGDSFGIMAGIEYPLISNKMHLMGDILSGNNAISVAVLGFVLFLPANWQLSFGAQIPSPSSNNEYGMVFEITKL